MKKKRQGDFLTLFMEFEMRISSQATLMFDLVKSCFIIKYNQSISQTHQMSFFILEDDDFYSRLPSYKASPKTRNDFKRKQVFPEINRNDDAIMESFNDFQIHKDGSDYCKGQFLPEIELTGKFKGILFVKLQKKQNMFFFRLIILTPQQTALKVENSFQLSQSYRNLTYHYYMSPADSVRIGLNSSTRQIKINFPPIYTINTSIELQPGQKMQRKQIIFFKNMVQSHIVPINHQIKCIFKRQERPNLKDHFETVEKRQMKMIQRYSDISTVSSKIVANPLLQKNANSTIARKKKNLSQKVKLNMERLDESMRKTFQLFSDKTEHLERQYDLPENEIISIEKQLMMPVEIKFNKGPDTSAVINYIYIKHREKWDVNKVNEGGFADIYTINLHFWSLSNQFDKPQLHQEQLNKKELILKKEVSLASAFEMLGKKSTDQKKKGRVEHQLKIIEQLSSAKPIFLPKYYIPTNKINPFPKSLLLDYFSTKTLTEFIQSYSISLSLQTKLCYMFSIAQSLRYLRQYEVVHLDLKPANILMYHSMLVKIIDFGESYHPKVCDKDYYPGFTVPYSCPQLYSNKMTFTNKSDVFSMGVIFYEMLYSRCPFDIHVNTTKIDQQMCKYSELWYCVPEEMQSYGESEVLQQLNLMISRCLSVRPEDRPELDWIALILRQLIDLVY